MRLWPENQRVYEQMHQRIHKLRKSEPVPLKFKVTVLLITLSLAFQSKNVPNKTFVWVIQGVA